MTIQEAVKSGKDFKPVGWGDHFWMRVVGGFVLYSSEQLDSLSMRPSVTDVLILSDYEIKP
jgi:hypothetical protein